MITNNNTRTAAATYPQACLSAYCGKMQCPPGCRHLPALMEFKRTQTAVSVKKPNRPENKGTP